MSQAFLPGIDVLLTRNRRWLKGRRVGLVTHAAAVDRRGATTAQRLAGDPGVNLVCLMAPEHGFSGRAGAGERCAGYRHPDWGIPVHSLYGETRRPTADMLAGVDTIVVDLQDLGCRAYTYVSTLALVMEAAAQSGKAVIVADRPVPLPNTVDGPLLEPARRSFVGWITTPVSYGMTLGEAAVWLNRYGGGAGADLHVARMQGYRREAHRDGAWFPWVPPSPAIRSWECAMSFHATVLLEAFGAVDHGRAGPLPFQVVGSAWMQGARVCEALGGEDLPGVRFYPHRYEPPAGAGPVREFHGVRLAVTDPDAFQPVRTGCALIHVLQALYGPRRLWATATARPAFLDQLMGADSVRLGLRAGTPVAAMAGSWRAQAHTFRRQRSDCLLYER